MTNVKKSEKYLFNQKPSKNQTTRFKNGENVQNGSVGV